MRRLVEMLLFVVLAPLPLFVEFSDYVDLGHGEIMLTTTPPAFVIAGLVALLAWGIAAAMARFAPPRGKSAGSAFAVRFAVAWLLMMGAAMLFWMGGGGGASLSKVLWPAGKATLGVGMAMLGALLAGAARRTA